MTFGRLDEALLGRLPTFQNSFEIDAMDTETFTRPSTSVTWQGPGPAEHSPSWDSMRRVAGLVTMEGPQNPSRTGDQLGPRSPGTPRGAEHTTKARKKDVFTDGKNQELRNNFHHVCKKDSAFTAGRSTEKRNHGETITGSEQRKTSTCRHSPPAEPRKGPKDHLQQNTSI